MGNSEDSVYIQGANDTTVRGTSLGARNLIYNNGRHGVQIRKATTTDNSVIGNDIAKNDADGVFIVRNASGNTIGGPQTAGAANLIHSNGGAGVRIATGTGNSVISNSIFSNTGLGIDLFPYGVTVNDTDDPDAGANNLQNTPLITSATRDASTGATTITGTLNSNPNQSYSIQRFGTESGGDPSNYGRRGQYPARYDNNYNRRRQRLGHLHLHFWYPPRGE